MVSAGELAYLHVVGVVVVRRTLVSVVKAPHVSDVGNFVVAAVKELLEVFCGLDEFRKPNKRWKVGLPTLNVSASEFDRRGVRNSSLL